MKHCMFVGKNSGSVFLKSVAQTKSISLLFSEYLFVQDVSDNCESLLLLDTIVNPLQMTGEYGWMKTIPEVKVLPGTKKPWEQLIKRTVEEVVL